MNNDSNKSTTRTTFRSNQMVAYQEYIDYSTKSQDWVNGKGREQSLKSRCKSVSAKGSFPMKLYHMLDHLENAGLAHIASFQPHGRALRIHLHQQFLKEILPRYFPDINNIASFLRQLNIYGFRRMINNGPDRDSYYHAMFLRGRPDLCSLIERPLKSRHSKRQKYDPMTEPKFYTMSPIQLLPNPNENSYFFASGNTLVKEAPTIDLNPKPKNSPTDCVSDTDNTIPNVADSMETSLDFNSNTSTTASVNDETSGKVTFFASTYSHRHKNALPNEKEDIGSYRTPLFGHHPNTTINNAMTTYNASERSAAASDSVGFNATNNNHNNIVPAAVVAAASSLLATPYVPRNPAEASFSIVDQYCENLAVNILKQACYQMHSQSNTQEEIQGNNQITRNQ